LPSKAQRSDKYLKRDNYDGCNENLLYFCENIFGTGTLAIVRCAELSTIFDIFSGKLKKRIFDSTLQLTSDGAGKKEHCL
jgi:hypothetical protein